MAKKKGIFKALFGRKEGGSVVGNLLRGVGDKFTGGLYSKVFQPGAKGLFGKNKIGTPAPANEGIASQILQQQQQLQQPDPAQPSSIMQTIKKNWAYVLGGIAGLAALWYFILKPKKKGGYRR